MGLLTPKRVDEPELLDEHDAPRADVERSLRDLRRINRYLGGIATYRRMVRRLTPAPAPTILDIGAGSTDIIDAIPNIRAIALDFKIDHLLYERARSRAKRVVGDARALPFRDGAVDVVTSAHFFHHFSPEENAGILFESLRASRIGVAVNDTRRHYLPLLFVRLLCTLRIFSRITRVDAPGSVLRGYTIAEAREIAGRVPAKERAVVRFMPFRFGILLWKN